MEQLDKKTQKAFFAKAAQFRKFSGAANQTVDIDTSDLEHLSNEEVNAIEGNAQREIMIIIGSKKVGKTELWMQEIRANAPKDAAYWSPVVEQYFDNQYMNLAFKAEGKLIQVEPEHRSELVPLTK